MVELIADSYCTDHIFAVTFTHTALWVTRQVIPHVVELDKAQRWQHQVEVTNVTTDRLIGWDAFLVVQGGLELEVVTTAQHIVDIRRRTLVGHIGATVITAHVFFEVELSDRYVDLWHG